MSERFLITAAYGCIGAWSVRQLVREGVEVIGIDARDDDHRRTVNEVSREAREAQSLAARNGFDAAAVSDRSKGTPWPL